jgi:hypothetical protein
LADFRNDELTNNDMSAIGIGISPIMRCGGGVAPSFVPFEEKTYSVLDTIDNGGYNTITSLSQHPTNKNKIIMTYLAGPVGSHGYDATKVLKMKVSNDKGQTWSAGTTIYDPGGILCVQEQHAGYDSNGRLHILATNIDDATPGICTLIYLYSDNDGGNFTVTDITSLVADVILPVFRNSGNLIENNGVMMEIIYRQNAAVTSSNRSILRLVAGTWTQVDIETTAAYENESSIVSLGGDNILLLVRDDVTNSFIQYLSADNGLTWTRQGVAFLGITISFFYQFARPGQLHKFKMNGEDIIVMYMTKNASPLGCVYAIYARASDLLANGILGWDYSTLKKIAEADSPIYSFVCHGDSIHYNDNYNAIGCWPHALSDWSIESIYTFEQDTTDYDTLYGALFGRVEDYIIAAALTDAGQLAAIRAFDAGLISNNLRCKTVAYYPFIGGTATKHKWNLINPLDTDATFRLTFVNGAGTGWIHAATGAKPDGTGSYARTHIIPSTNLILYSQGMGYYARENISEAGVDMGASHDDGGGHTNPCMMLRVRYNGDNKGRFYCNNGYTAADVALGAAVADSRGFTSGSRTANNANKIFYNGVQSGVTNATAALNNTAGFEIYIGANNADGVAASFTTKETAGNIIKLGFTDAQELILYNLIQALQTALGRQV